jgi:hypothetical protein
MVPRGVFESFYVSLSIYYARCCYSGWFMELAFVLQENPCRWFLRKVAVLRFCLYSPSTFKMSDIGTLCIRVRLPASRVDRQFNSSAFR